MNHLQRYLQGFAAYFLGSCVALVVDTGVLLLALRLGSSLQFAAALGFASGMIVSYAVSVRYAFAHRTLRERRLAEFLGFVFIGILGMCLTQILLWIGVHQFGLSVLYAKGVAAASVFGFNYSLRKVLLFMPRSAIKVLS